MSAEKATITVTEDTFAETIEKGGVVLLDFWAAWCGPCRAFAPVFEAAAQRHPDVVFGKVDTEAQPALAAAFGIRAIPTLAAIRDGVVLSVRPGMVPAQALDRIIEETKALDLTEVLKELEAVRAERQASLNAPEAREERA